MKLPDFSPQQFDRLWELMNTELDNLGMNEFKSSLTGITGQVCSICRLSSVLHFWGSVVWRILSTF